MRKFLDILAWIIVGVIVVPIMAGFIWAIIANAIELGWIAAALWLGFAVFIWAICRTQNT